MNEIDGGLRGNWRMTLRSGGRAESENLPDADARVLRSDNENIRVVAS